MRRSWVSWPSMFPTRRATATSLTKRLALPGPGSASRASSPHPGSTPGRRRGGRCSSASASSSCPASCRAATPASRFVRPSSRPRPTSTACAASPPCLSSSATTFTRPLSLPRAGAPASPTTTSSSCPLSASGTRDRPPSACSSSFPDMPSPTGRSSWCVATPRPTLATHSAP